jgi:hypothetical protein
MGTRAQQVLVDEMQTKATEEQLALENWSLADLRERIRVELLAHLALIGLDSRPSNDVYAPSKDLIRAHHAAQRAAYRESERHFVQRYGQKLLSHFAEGKDIQPHAVEPSLTLVQSASEDARLFRLATLLWSVPVSRGYGRRMRFLVRDRTNGKLIGIFALTDPVFNLQARDVWIGWNAQDRRERLVNVMDAHVVGAVPPYSSLLGGKITAALMTSQEVCGAFAAKYNQSSGIISQQQKHAQLALITVTSALGRSSLYNRLKLSGLVDFRLIGQTNGWGHFHIPQSLFSLMRELLRREEHTYVSGYAFGQGPNWRLRVVREAVRSVGLDQSLLRHGINRDIYAVPLATNWHDYLRGTGDLIAIQRPSADEIGEAAVKRWLQPRAQTRTEYQHWNRQLIWEQIVGHIQL